MKVGSWKHWILVVLLAVALAACGGGTDDSAESQQPVQVTKIGQVLVTRYFEVTVNNVVEADRINESMFGADEAGAGNKFVVLDVTVKNTDSRSRMFEIGSLQIDQQGKRLKFISTKEISGAKSLVMETLNPLTTVTAKVVFTVPKEAAGVMYWEPDNDDKLILLSQGNVSVDAAPSDATLGVSTAPDSGRAMDEQRCGNMYRNLTPADMSDKAVAEFESACPGYDLPVQWQNAALREAMREEQAMPSFDCSKASTDTEKLICSDASVAELDKELADTFKQVIPQVSSSAILKESQLNWIVSVRDKCPDAQCLTRAYVDRINELQNMTP